MSKRETATWGPNAARLRQARGWSQEVLAERAGVSQQYISGQNIGRRNPTIVTIDELASALGVSHVDLVQPD